MKGADYIGAFNDKRLEKRGLQLLGRLFSTSSRVIQQIAHSRAKQKGFYRFLNNGKVSEEAFIKEMAGRCGKAAAGKVVLCIQDTTEVNLSRHKNRLKPAAISKPQGHSSDKKSVSVRIVEAREVTAGIENPIAWKLITTLPVDSFADARQVLEGYSCRWMIEEVYRVMKKEGFNIEGSELESGWAIRKLSLMLMDTIIKLFQMQYAYNIPEEEGIAGAVSFDEQELACLEAITPKWEGKTDKQQNPYKKKSLARVSGTIARLGGWKGYQSQRPPGLITWLNGLKKIYALFEGWNLQKDVGTL